MRLLILLAAIIVLIFAVRGLLPRSRPKARSDTNTQVPEKMVACAKCQLYLPESEALQADNVFFCNREHHKAWLEDHSKKG